MNFLQETIEDIKRWGHNFEDIIFIGSRESGHSCTWDEFCSLADFEYDDGYGRQEIARDLEIIFSDWSILHRSEYDGSECWAYFKNRPIPTTTKPIRYFKGDCSEVSLGELND